MRIVFFILSSILFAIPCVAQERFFEFLPGWRNWSIAENNENLTSVGLVSESIGLNHYQFSSISQLGTIDSLWQFDLDTIQSYESFFSNDISFEGNRSYITGGFRGNSDKRFGSLLILDENFQDTIRLNTLNILPGNGTLVRSHLTLNSNQFILGGFLQNTDFQVYPSLMQVDSLGAIAWRKDFFCGTDCDLYPFHIMQAADGGYFFTCTEIRNFDMPEEAEKTAIIKTDSEGNQQYRLYPGEEDLFAVAGWVLPTADGNYLTAYTDPMTVTDNLPQINFEKTIWLKKIDISGDEIFLKGFYDELPKASDDRGFSYYIRKMLIAEDGNVLIAGNKTTLDDEGFLMKFTQEGELLWYRFYTPPQAEGNSAGLEYTRVYGVTQTSDGGYIMAGEYFSSAGNVFPEGIQTAIAIKVDEFGCLEPGCQIGDDIPEQELSPLGLQVYPNPASHEINLSIDPKYRIQRVKLYDVSGKSILYPSLPSASSGNSSGYGLSFEVKLDVSSLISGLYLIEVTTKEGLREVKRVVISD